MPEQPAEPQQPIQIINQVSPTPIQNNLPAPVVNNLTPVADNGEANRIATKSYRVNFALALLTLIAIGVSIWVGCISRNALITSNKALEFAQQESQKADSLHNVENRDAQIRQHIVDSISSRKDSITFDNNRKSLDAQLGVLNETMKQFSINNEPFLELKVVAPPRVCT